MQIRMAEISDAAAIAAIYAPYVAETTVSFEYVPPTAAEIPWFILPQLLPPMRMAWPKS